jgi:hypothetical protein
MITSQEASRTTSLPLIVWENGRCVGGGIVDRSWPAAILADTFQELHDLAEPSEIQQVWRIRHHLRCRCTCVVGQMHSDGGVGAIR